MNAVAVPDGADRRRANFYRGATREPGPVSITKDQVANVIVSIMRTDSAGTYVDTALASTIAGQVLPSIIKQFPGMSPEQLSSQASFRSMLQLYIAPNATDERTAAQKRLAAANVTSADFAAAGRVADNGLAAPFFGRRGPDGGGPSSFARIAELGGVTSTEIARNIDQARAEAIRLGIPWAANNSDLLRLGPAAIKAIAATNLTETGYKALHNGAHYEAPDVVAFAKHSKLRGFDAEKAAKSTEALVQALPPAEQKSTAEVLKRFDHAAAAYYANPNDAAARERFEAAGRAHKERMEEIARRSEADRARVQSLEDDKRVEQRFRATVVGNEHTAVADVTRREAAVAGTAVKLDELDAALVPRATDTKPTDAPPADAKKTPAAAPKAAAPPKP